MPISSVVVATAQGDVRGLERDGVSIYLGIPYGASTEAANRFRPPNPPASWQGVRLATKFGPISPQRDASCSAWHIPEAQGENCLVLNVWTPAPLGSTRLPVMVWLHGGAYSFGSANSRIYDGAELAGTGEVVVVSINHRLNAFGYLYLGGIDAEFESSANLGQLDIVAALKWVRENIGGFGGDSSNVTVFGESGGGGKVCTLIGMPAAKGLFHRVIVMSGALIAPLTLDEATAVADTLLGTLGLEHRRVAELRTMSAERILTALADNPELAMPLFRPVLDGDVLVNPPLVLGAAGLVERIDLIIGTTLDELSGFLLTPGINQPLPDDETLTRAIEGTWLATSLARALTTDEIAAMIAVYRLNYPLASRQEILVRLGSRANFTQSAVLQSEQAIAQGHRVFAYRFDWQWPMFGGMYAPHLVELPFLFGTLDHQGEVFEQNGEDSPSMRVQDDPSGDRYQISRAMMKAFAAFARNGDPSTSTLSWPPYSVARRETMLFNRQMRVINDPDGAIRAAWPI